MNEEYRTLKELQNTINTIKSLEKEYDTLINKKAKIEATTVDYKHHHFPFAKAVKDLESKAKSKSVGNAIIRFLFTFLFCIFIAGLITGIYYTLYILDIIPAFLKDYHTYILIGLSALVLIITYIISHKRIQHFLIEYRKKHIISKHKDKLKEAKEQSIEEADRYQLELNARVKTINQNLRTIETNIKGHQHKLEKNPPLPNKFLPALDDIIMYFEDKRTESLKDAINLYVKETQEKTRFTRLLYAIKDDTIPIEVLLDENVSLDTYEPPHTTKPVTASIEEASSSGLNADMTLEKTETAHQDTQETSNHSEEPTSQPQEVLK
ncbi:MAG: hypothetical protein ACOC1L_05815, partial [Bacillota bacterium]